MQSKGPSKPRVIYAIEMHDDQFGWVRCMEGMDIPTCAVKRTTARLLLKQVQDRTGSTLRICRYIEEHRA